MQASIRYKFSDKVICCATMDICIEIKGIRDLNDALHDGVDLG